MLTEKTRASLNTALAELLAEKDKLESGIEGLRALLDEAAKAGAPPQKAPAPAAGNGKLKVEPKRFSREGWAKRYEAQLTAAGIPFTTKMKEGDWCVTPNA